MQYRSHGWATPVDGSCFDFRIGHYPYAGAWTQQNFLLEHLWAHIYAHNSWSFEGTSFVAFLFFLQQCRRGCLASIICTTPRHMPNFQQKLVEGEDMLQELPQHNSLISLYASCSTVHSISTARNSEKWQNTLLLPFQTTYIFHKALSLAVFLRNPVNYSSIQHFCSSICCSSFCW